MDMKITCENVLYEGELRPLEVGISNGKVIQLGSSLGNSERKIDLRDKWLIPGIIDGHVHFRDPGEPEKEDFRSGSRAAARGGVTTVVDMPNNKPPIKTLERFIEKRESAKTKSIVNFALYAGVPYDLSQVNKIAQEGAIGFKYYMAQEEVDLAELFAAIKQVNSLLTVHAEDPEFINRDGKELTSPEEYLKSRPTLAEISGVKKLVERNVPQLHIAHATLAKTIELAKERATTEVTPHHLLLAADEVDLSDFTAIMNPPLRTSNQREELEQIFLDEVDLIASDHAPHLKEQKRTADPNLGMPGLPGVETILPLSLTYADRAGLPIEKVIQKLTVNPAKLFGFHQRGEIKVDNWADLTVIDPDREKPVRGSDFFSRAKITPFEGRRASYWPEMTIVNGKIVYARGQIKHEGAGQFLRG